jgi:hypothetical protein
MGALGSAFDIIIVGALALPSVLLVIHLFFSDHESSLKTLLAWVKDQNQPTLVSVLLFAMAFPMGTAVSRIAQDFFDDADLHLHINAFGYERWFRLPVATETNIRTDVYCEAQEQIQKLTPSAPSTDKTPPFTQSTLQDSSCTSTGGRLGPKTNDLWQAKQDLEELATRVCRVQEAALLLQGTDSNERLRQFHDQIVVLRGAAFNGMIAFSLCFYWWSVRFKSRLRWSAPVALSLLGINALYNHLIERPASDPPYMEFTLLVLAAAGWYVLWPRAPKATGAPGEAQTEDGRGTIRVPYLFLAAFLTASSFLGWWSTQVLYDQQVFYSYQALIRNAKPAAPPTK